MNPNSMEEVLQQWPENEPVAHVNAWHAECGAYADWHWKHRGESIGRTYEARVIGTIRGQDVIEHILK